MAPDPPTTASDTEQDRLRQLVLLDIATAATAVAVMSAVYAFVIDSVWLLLLIAMVSIAGLVMGISLVPLRRGDLGAAVAWLAAANWTIAGASTLIATFAWPLMMLAALLPAVVAAPYVSERRLRAYVIASFTVSVIVVVIGLYQDVSHFEEQLPAWLPPIILLLFTPFLAGMVVITALQHSTRLRAALAETTVANQALLGSRARLVVATDRERRRVERDLHDGAQQQLIAIGLRLRQARDLCEDDPQRAAALLDLARADVRAAHDELRRLAHGIYPPVLTLHGLGPALETVADECPLPVTIDIADIARYPADIEAAVYFCCAEALQNATKHAGPEASVTVAVRARADAIEFSVIDDGKGFEHASLPESFGIASMSDRLGAAGGTLEVRSTPGHGTTVTGRISIAAGRTYARAVTPPG